MKYLLFIFIVFTYTKIYSQDINGLYNSKLTIFQSEKKPENNFTRIIDDYITIDVYDKPYTRGTLEITSKSTEGESTTIKFIVKGDKKYLYEDGETYISYDCAISLLGIESSQMCTVAIDVNGKSLIVLFKEGTQLYDLKKI